MAETNFIQSLPEILQALNCQPYTFASPAPQNKQRDKFKSDFFATFQRNIYCAKNKIISKLQSIIAEGIYQPIGSDQLNLYSCIKNELSLLNRNVENLLKDGMLTLYMDLNELRLKAIRLNFSNVAQELLKCCIEALNKLVKQYFVFKQYEIRRKLNSKINQSNQLFSEKNMNGETKLEDKCFSLKKIEDIILRQVQQYIESKPLAQLFELQMKKEQKVLGQSFQVCRICSQSIKIKDLQKHVYICAKKCELKLQIQVKNQQIAEIQNKIKAQFLQSCKVFVKEQIDQEFRNICKLILHFPKKHQRLFFRTNSLIGLRGGKDIFNKIQSSILSHIEVYGENKLLTQWLTIYKQRTIIEKQISNIEVSSLFSQSHQKSQQLDPILERKMLVHPSKKKLTAFSNQVQKIKLKSYKSLRIQSAQYSSTSSQQSQSSQSKKNKQEDIMEVFRSRKSLSKKLGKESQEEIQFNVSSINHYSSLPNLPQQNQLNQPKSNISLSSFEILKFLGQGAFGKVYMARRKETKDVYALKIIKLPQKPQEQQLKSIKNQYQIFKMIGGDHLVNAPFSFSQGSSQIFIMQYMPGGDLRKLLTDQVYFQEDLAKNYLAQIVLAVELLHNSGIIHRDLKPENLVIDRKGHLKLTDFGLSQLQASQKLEKSKKSQADALNELNEAKQSKHRKRRAAFSAATKQKIKLIGSPDYIAPQIISQTSFSNYTIDWWSLGVMAYELLIGARPFCGDSINQIIDNITNFNIQWPEVGYQEGMISPQAKDFIAQLLNKNFMQRLGANGAHELKNHPFFNGVDWKNVKSSSMAFLPKKMATLYEMASMQENIALRQQIKQFIKDKKQLSKKVKLETFVRYDLLKDETIANIQKKQEMSTLKLKKLSTLKKIAFQLQQQVQVNDQSSIK